jgi:hypothetical protein
MIHVTADFYIVMPGLDPGIHDEAPRPPKDRMDCRAGKLAQPA